jgi:uncharacterized protein RhaS with RHS repeats
MQRFISQDPNGLAAGVNLYAYANNSPLNYTDPFSNITLTIQSNQYFPGQARFISAAHTHSADAVWTTGHVSRQMLSRYSHIGMEAKAEKRAPAVPAAEKAHPSEVFTWGGYKIGHCAGF